MPTSPLEPLAQLRAHLVDETSRALAEALHRQDAARGAFARARAALEHHRRAIADVTAMERSALERHGQRASDWGRLETWSARAAIEDRALARCAEEAQRALAASEREVDRVRDALLRRKSEADAVETYRARAEARARRAVEAREEEAHGDAWRPLGFR